MVKQQPWIHLIQTRLGGTGMVQWGERSPPTNEARVQFPDPAVHQISLSSKSNISKSQFDPGMDGHFKRVLENSWCSVGKQITFKAF